MKPKLVFLDEPTSGLDSYAAHNVIRRRELVSGEFWEFSESVWGGKERRTQWPSVSF